MLSQWKLEGLNSKAGQSGAHTLTRAHDLSRAHCLNRAHLVALGFTMLSSVMVSSCGGFEPDYRAGSGALSSGSSSADGSCIKKETLAQGSAVQNGPSVSSPSAAQGGTAQAQGGTAQAQGGTAQAQGGNVQGAKVTNAQVFALMATYQCTGCHARTPPLIKTEADTVNNAKSIQDSIKNNRMPKAGYTQVSAADKKIIVTDWNPSAPGAALRLSGAELLLAGGATYNGAVKKIMVDNCLSCHNVGGKEPILATYSLVKKNFDASIAAISKGTMPPSGALKQADVTSLKDWAAGGFELGDASGAATQAAGNTVQQGLGSASGSSDCK